MSDDTDELARTLSSVVRGTAILRFWILMPLIVGYAALLAWILGTLL